MKPNFILWKWESPTYRTRFTPQHVNTAVAMIRRHHSAPHRTICVTDDPRGVDCETFPLWSDLNNLKNPSGLMLPSCYRRLKIFKAETTRQMGIADDDKVVSMDLDMVVTGDIEPLFAGDEDFMGWRGVGSFRPVIYNGSLFMFRAGRFGWLWDEFDPIKLPDETRQARYFGSDQAWMSYKFNGSKPGWDIAQGVFAYARDVRHRPLPDNARIVFFNGKVKPWDKQALAESPWITAHWRA